MDDAQALLIFLRRGMTAGCLRALLDYFGTALAAAEAGPSAWQHAGVVQAKIEKLRPLDERLIAADLRWLSDAEHHLIGWHQPAYPALLRSIAYPPAALFVCGDPELLRFPQIAVVGSRQSSVMGRDNAREFARAFADAGMIVTSGLAEGIDTAAHLGALERGSTVAVIATGSDLCFPTRNADLMARIVAEGVVVGEYPPGTAGRREHFPARNRLIAGLSLATVVIEAAQRSGALITARIAAESGRDVFALPGSIHNPMARGCHRLIRDGAGLVESPDEVLEAIAGLAARHAAEAMLPFQASLPTIAQEPMQQPPKPRQVTPDEQLLLAALGHDRVGFDQLVARTGLTVGTLSAMLLAMELDGRVSAEHGRYARRT